MNLSERIKRRRKQMRLSQEELALRVGYKSRSSINKIELGINDITQSKLVLFANALNTTVDYLMGNDGKVSCSFKIPVIGKVIAGIPMDAIEEIIDYEEIDSTMAGTGDFFALKIKGDSMTPEMKEGDVVIIKKQSHIESGQIAIILVNGYEATVKKVVKSHDSLTLVPFNNSYDPITYSSDDINDLPVTILGRVVELRKKY